MKNVKLKISKFCPLTKSDCIGEGCASCIKQDSRVMVNNNSTHYYDLQCTYFNNKIGDMEEKDSE
jgi:hypothetical protein